MRLYFDVIMSAAMASFCLSIRPTRAAAAFLSATTTSRRSTTRSPCRRPTMTTTTCSTRRRSFTTTSSQLSMVMNRGLEQKRESATPTGACVCVCVCVSLLHDFRVNTTIPSPLFAFTPSLPFLDSLFKNHLHFLHFHFF
jgi:hypothetical protein